MDIDCKPIASHPIDAPPDCDGCGEPIAYNEPAYYASTYGLGPTFYVCSEECGDRVASDYRAQYEAERAAYDAVDKIGSAPKE